MITTRKIDFFGGLHGNYLELVVNHCIDQNIYDISKNMFTATGACHNKNEDSAYEPITKARHYSFFNMPIDPDDFVIRVVPKSDDLLIAITNSMLRAGDQQLDLDNLEIDTYNKVSALPKLNLFLQTLVRDFGVRDQYSRSELRKYFYSMFEDFENGLGMLTKFRPHSKYYEFKFRNFFSFTKFYESLNEVAKFVELEFTPSSKLVQLHQEFLSKNQGWHSEHKCLQLIEAIIQGHDVDFNLNIIEEAWINYRISRSFNLYVIQELNQEVYPTNTLEIRALLN